MTTAIIFTVVIRDYGPITLLHDHDTSIHLTNPLVPDDAYPSSPHTPHLKSDLDADGVNLDVIGLPSTPSMDFESSTAHHIINIICM